MAGITKIHDFVYFSICLDPVKLLLKKTIVKFWKIEKKEKLLWGLSFVANRDRLFLGNVATARLPAQ